jgi:hypothetical protein
MSSQALDVAIGLVTTFVIVSILASAVVEGISIILKKRSRDLEAVISQIAANPADTKQKLDLYATSVFRSFEIAARRKRGPGAAADARKPSYISARSFADAVIEALAMAKAAAIDGQAQVDEVLARLPGNSPIKQRLESLVSEAGGDINAVKAGLEAWFDDTMDRLAGAYKRWSKWVLVAVGIVLAAAINVSTIRVVATLWTDGPVRSAVADSASVYAQQHRNDPNGLKSVQDAVSNLDALQLPVGWGDSWGRGGPAGYFIGVVITGLAVMLGAPFWFDLLTKLLALRSGGGGVPPKAASDPASATTTVNAAATSRPSSAPAAPLTAAMATFVAALPNLPTPSGSTSQSPKDAV